MKKKHAQTAVRRSGGSHGDGHVLHRLCLHLPFRLLELHSAWDEAVAAKSPEQVISVAQQTYDLLMPLGLGDDVCYNLEPKAGRPPGPVR